MKPLHSKRKRQFQLLEVMVAAFLILICAAPAIKIYVNIYLEQQEMLRQNHRDHLAHLAYAAVVEQLYKNEIPFEEIIQNKKFTLENAPDLNQDLRQFNYRCQYSFINRKTEEQKENQEYSLFNVIIQMQDILPNKLESKPMDYQFVTYISHQKNESENTDADAEQ